MFRVVNVAEHPGLRAPALSGALHRIDDGQIVEVPFVYHDPDAFQFILVIPDGAEGRELSERAKLLDALMQEPGDEVPSYVRHFRIVYGHDGLAEQVDERPAIDVDAPELEFEPVAELARPASGHPDYFPRLAAVLPRSTFIDHLATDLAALVADGELWLFARLDACSMHAFTESSAELSLRLKTIEGIPVCVLTLNDSSTGDSRSAFLNPDRAIDAPVLELLSREFSATVILSDPDGHLVRSFRAEAPLEVNARLVLDRAECAPSSTPECWGSAVEKARALLPTDSESHPFVPSGESAFVSEALARLRLLERWSTPDRLDHALLRLGVPAPDIEQSQREILTDAVRYGLSMTDPLVNDAVRFGLAEDPASLFSTMEGRFEQILAEAGHGLLDGDVQANRAELRRQRSRYGTSTGQDRSCTIDYSG